MSGLARCLTFIIRLPFYVLALALMTWAVYLFLSALHFCTPLLGLSWIFNHTYSTPGKVLYGLLIVSLLWPFAIFISMVFVYLGQLISYGFTVMFKLLPTLHNNIGNEQTVYFDDPSVAKQYALNNGYETITGASEEARRSVFLQGNEEYITPVVKGLVCGQAFQWYKTTYDVYAVEFPTKVFSHCYVRTNFSEEVSGVQAGAITGTLPIRLEADFGKYFTVYARDADQSSVRTILTPDVMLAILESVPRASIEFLQSTMFIQMKAATTIVGADANLQILKSVIKEVSEQQLSGLKVAQTRFIHRRTSINMGLLGDTSTIVILKLFGFTVLGLVSAGLVANIPVIGHILFLVSILVVLVSMIIIIIIILSLIYGYVLYQAVHFLKSIVVSYRISSLAKAYQRSYVGSTEVS